MGPIRSIAAIAATAAVFAHAAPPPITLRPVVSGLFEPVEIAFARDGSRRLYIAELNGRVRIFQDGVLLPQPFLDISAQVSLSGERGLLGLAFDPRYRFNGKFYVMYTSLPDDTVGGALRVSQFRRSSANPLLADPASERIVVEIPHPGASNHNGGKIAFAYGLLHVATGDGGGGGDAGNNAQSLATRLGKIQRFCVDCDSWTDSLVAGYNEGRAPTDAQTPVLMYGLRNPWRFSFDRVTGDMYIGDVGQGTVEEIDFIPALDAAVGGQNMGWRVLEGNNCFNPATAGCQSSLTPWPATALHPDGWLDYRAPVLTYLHDAQGGDAVTGGFVYRGLKSSAMRGYYFYGDYGSSRIWAARRESGRWIAAPVSEAPNGISGLSTFGEDEDGELYVANLIDGIIYAIDGPADAVPPRNVALARDGAIATASSEASQNFVAANAIDGDRLGNYWGPGVAWIPSSNGPRPDTLQVDFGRTEKIDHVTVVGYVREFPGQGYEPYESTSCAYTATDFDVRVRVSGMWRTVGSVRGNGLCIRSVSFKATNADAIQLVSYGMNLVIAEIEAWTPAPPTMPGARGN